MEKLKGVRFCDVVGYVLCSVLGSFICLWFFVFGVFGGFLDVPCGHSLKGLIVFPICLLRRTKLFVKFFQISRMCGVAV